MAHDDGNLAGSEGNPMGLVADGCGFGSHLYRLLDQSPRLVLCKEPELYNNSTETKDGNMNKSNMTSMQIAALLGMGALSSGMPDTSRHSSFRAALGRAMFWGKQPKPYKRKVPSTQHDYFMLERAERKRERKAEKLAAHGFGTVTFHMPSTAEVLRNLVANSDMQVHHV